MNMYLKIRSPMDSCAFTLNLLKAYVTGTILIGWPSLVISLNYLSLIQNTHGQRKFERICGFSYLNISHIRGHKLLSCKINFFKNYFMKTIRESNSLDSDWDRCSVGPDLGPNCLRGLSADDKCCP